MYLWGCDLNLGNTNRIIDVNKSTILQWHQYCRDIASNKIVRVFCEESRFKIGGPGIIVQVDESVFSKRKFHRGRLTPQKWVLGMLDTRSKLLVLEFVPNRSAETLLRVLVRNVAPGSIIWSDLWRGYANLEAQGFTHQTVNHSENFVDPETGTCTNAIEGAWSRVKYFLRKKGVMHKQNSSSYLDEYMWRRLFQDSEHPGITLKHILQHLLQWSKYSFLSS